jgi:hypothetical protein
VGGGGSVVAVLPRNIGHHLARLAGGRVVAERLLDLSSLDPLAWSLAGDQVFLANGGTVYAFRTADLKPLWQRPLAEGTRLRHTGGALLAWPARMPACQIAFRISGRSVQWQAGPLLPPDEYLSVSALDPTSGELVQRFNFPAGSGRVRRCQAPSAGGLFPALRLQADPTTAGAPVLFPAGGGLLVQAGGHAWFFR